MGSLIFFPETEKFHRAPEHGSRSPAVQACRLRFRPVRNPGDLRLSRNRRGRRLKEIAEEAGETPALLSAELQ
jgi:hypothetical protein